MIDEKEKAGALTVALRRSAVNILQMLTPEEHDNYEQLVHRLSTRYGLAHLQLKNLQQNINKNLK